MNRKEIKSIAWMAMNDFTELAGLADAVSNIEFHKSSAVTEDEWPTLQVGNTIIDMLPGNDNEILIQVTDAESGFGHEELCASEDAVDLFFRTFNGLRSVRKFF